MGGGDKRSAGGEFGEFEGEDDAAIGADEGAVVIEVNGNRFTFGAGDGGLSGIGEFLGGRDAAALAGCVGDGLKGAFAIGTDVVEAALRFATVEDVFRATVRAGDFELAGHQPRIAKNSR